MPQWGPGDFLPLPAAPAFLAKQETLPAAILRWRSGPQAGAAAIAFGRAIAIEAAMGAGSRDQSKEN